ncbi:MAG TPA: MASE1 domain-containing protein [Bacteroidia bacterium]|jgi:signal transduction histidine kinase|nr:MASE1 domain-containing protein [Bacteroidia bacterium]
MLQANNHFAQRLVKITVVATIYFFAARLGLLLQLGHTNASPVWPPSGIAFTALLIFGIELWPGILLGALLANISVFSSNQVAPKHIILLMSGGIAIGNTLETVIGYYLIKYFKCQQILSKSRDFAMFFIIVLVMCLSSSILGSLILGANNIISWQDYKTVWFTWWTGDVSGIIILTPALLAWWKPKRREWDTASVVQVILLFVVLIMYLGAIFGEWLPIGFNKAKIFIIFFIITWCVFRMSQRQLSLVILLISSYSIYSTFIGSGPFIDASPNLSLISLQVFLCVISISMMFLSTTLNARRISEEELKVLNAGLEAKVAERTHALEMQKEKLEQANIQLVRKAKALEDINKESRAFAHVVSHDLREPIRSIVSYLQLLEERYKNKLDRDADLYIDFAVNGAKRMSVLIEDLLTYSRIEHNQGEFVEVDLNEIISVVKNSLHTVIAENEAQIIVNNKLPIIMADYSQMMQLFQNLIDNGIKYKGAEKPVIKITSRKMKGKWLISVEDNGIGISKEYFDRIFVIFQRLHTRDHYEGTGIGLAICKKIVEKHGGEIWVESKEGKGSIFNFTWPEIAGPS